MPEEPPPNSPAAPKSPGGRRRGHRGGRGRRRPARPLPPPVEKDFSAPSASVEEPPVPVEPRELREVPPEREFHGSAINRAVEEVTRITEELRQALAQMEEVLELVELAERQKVGDEQEIESLRRALRRIHHPRDQRDHSRPED